METRKEGWLSKNHAGGSYAKESQRRWFETVGFTVCYYRESDKKSLKGHFDLRNVEKLKLVATEDDKAAGGADAVILSISEEGKAPKQMTISFKEDKGARVGWLKLWASAVAAAGVDKQLQQHIDPALSALLNEKYATQEAVSRQRSIFGSQVAYTKVLTPRQSSNAIAQAQAGAGAASSGLDTPRPGELPPPASLPPPTSLPGVPENEAPTTFEITVPEGVKPGDRLQATTPQGTKVKLVVPEGAEPGMLLTFQVPKDAKKKKALAKEDSIKQEKSAIAIQKRLRGMRTRKVVKPPSVAKPQMKISDEDVADLSKAAVKLQSNFRGLATRNAQQESARLQWLEYYIETEDWEQAGGLAVTPEEEASIEKAKLAAAANEGVSEDEERRQKWLKYYLNQAEFAKAEELVASPFESAMLLKAKALRSNACCSCLPKGALEMERVARFVASVRAYEWDMAEVLAMTSEEMQDVADSKLRVAHFQQAMSEGKYDEAKGLAITDGEEAQIVSAMRAAGGNGFAKVDSHHLVSSMSVSDVPVTAETEKAALKVQAIVRGHQVRDHQEEARRVEWLRYYAAERQLDEALKLAIKPHEEAAIKRMQAGDVKGGIAALLATGPSTMVKKSAEFVEAIKTYDWAKAEKYAATAQDRQDLADSKARVQWLEEYAKRGDGEKAKSLAITDAEVKRIDWVLGGKTFEQAIQSYEWDIARQLATSAQERADVADSEARVQWLERHLVAGEMAKAAELAITDAEIFKIQQAQKSAKQ